MKRLNVAFILGISFFLCAGCDPGASGESGDADGDEERTAEALSALLADNSLAPNSLAPNSLAPNSLAPNSLAPNSLAPNSLAALQAATADGAAVRQLLKYTVSCALGPTQSFAFSWTDAISLNHNEVYWGLLGIAPTWATSPLTDEGSQRLVSACLAARVNYYGVSVVISMRSALDPLATATNSAELAAYPHIEGAFWGNLFAATPYLSSCYEPSDVAISRIAMRDCAVGHLSNDQTEPCGMIALAGPCSEVCEGIDSAGQYYPSCVDHPGVGGSPSTTDVITTALP